ncbi:hypothetical protein LAZ67_15002039, partial [Cordylochernes scorpioides]
MKGATMGSPISPNAACITIGQLEIKALNSLKNDVYYFKRYVDDSILFINQGNIALVKNNASVGSQVAVELSRLKASQSSSIAQQRTSQVNNNSKQP